MKKIRAFSRSPMGTTLMFMVAVLLLMTGTIGGVRATPQIFNPDFAYGGVELDQIGITLVESVDGEWTNVSWRDYDKDSESFVVNSNSSDPKMGVILQNLDNMIPAGEQFKIGYAYPDVLAVKNSGTIPEYVRVTIYKYWVAEDPETGEKTRFDVYDSNGEDILNKLIELNFPEGNGWVRDPDPTTNTAERTVLYYKYKVPSATTATDPDDIYTNPFITTVRIKDEILDYGEKVYTNTDKTAWTWSWVADGLEFRIEAWADGVQDHNARAAMKSAWGLTDAQIDSFGIVFG